MNQDQDERMIKYLAIQTLFLGMVLVGALLGLLLKWIMS